MRLPILGYPGFEASDDGNIYRLARVGKFYPVIKEKKLGLMKSTHGYHLVSIKGPNDKKWTKRFAHRLIAKAFLPSADESLCINHKDGNKTNNHPSNLEWVTLAQNNTHARETGLYRGNPNPPCGANHAEAKLTEAQALEIKEAAWSGEKITAIAKRYGIVHQLVSQIKLGRAWAHLHTASWQARCNSQLRHA